MRFHYLNKLAPCFVKLNGQHLRCRMFATQADAVDVSKKSASGGGIGGLFQRISSFLVGAGLTALGTQYFLWDELRRSNLLLIEKQAALEKRIAKLEKH